MYLLEYFYEILSSQQKKLSRGEPRYYPFLIFTILLISPIDSALRLSLQMLSPRISGSLMGARILMGMDGVYIMAIALSAILTWLIFDRRRVSIEQRFEGMQQSPSLVVTYLWVFSSLLFSVSIGLAEQMSELLAVLLFLAFVGFGSWFLKRRLQTNAP